MGSDSEGRNDGFLFHALPEFNQRLVEGVDTDVAKPRVLDARDWREALHHRNAIQALPGCVRQGEALNLRDRIGRRRIKVR